MIKIRKSFPPTIIGKSGVCKLIEETNLNKKKFDLDKNNYNSGFLKFSFDSALYGHSIIKSLLIRNQNGKCAFCEQNVISVSHGDIEHFRPKGGYKQNKKNGISYPGYYWLAYEWDNLLFACQICNQRHKENLFPLLDPNKRAISHHSEIKNEKPYFINPAKENPKFLIKFNKEIATGIDKGGRGKKTIEAIGLNRSGNGQSDLIELRRDYFELISQIL